jgi:DNA polymerase-1
MPIQGLAADIMKLAMIRVAEALLPFGEDAKMILQVHDELIVEAKEGVSAAVASAMKRAMEEAYPHRVPLIAEVAEGKNWGEI